MGKANTNLYQAIADRDLQAIRCFVVDQQNLLLKDWQDGSLEQIHSTIQQSLQKSHRVKRQLEVPGGEIPYELGVWEGWIQAFRVLYDMENRKKEILDVYSAKNSDTSAIVEFLFRMEQPIRHEELAVALGVAYGELTDFMRRLIGCGAVSVFRTGKNTRYVLT